jgi:hypothetical protein
MGGSVAGLGWQLVVQARFESGMSFRLPWLIKVSRFESIERSAGTACGRTSRSATGALKGCGFNLRRTSLSKTLRHGREAVPFKTPALGVLPQPLEALRHPKSGALVLSGWVSSWT